MQGCLVRVNITVNILSLISWWIGQDIDNIHVLLELLLGLGVFFSPTTHGQRNATRCAVLREL
jgi:hypothetical protein